MYNAPAVSYPVGRSHFQTGLMLAVVIAGAAAQGLWWWSTVHGAGHVSGLVLWLVTSAWVVWGVLHTPHAPLVWDGQGWMWGSSVTSHTVVPQVILDAQHSLLLRLRPATGASIWVWPAQQAQPERWLALRRALFNPSSPAGKTDPARMAAPPEA